MRRLGEDMALLSSISSTLDSLSSFVIGRPELEYDLWEGQFAFEDRTGTVSNSSLGSPTKSEDHNSLPKISGKQLVLHLQTLQQQVAAIADNRTHTDERYSRTKQENAALNVRIQMLEESLRDVELRAEQRLAEEQKRHRELIVRVERERQLEVENCTIRLQAAEKELQGVREEATRLRSQTERLRSERNALQDRLSDLEVALEDGKLELRKSTELARREREDYALERASAKQAHADLNQEIEVLKSLLNAAKPPSVSLARSPSVSDSSPQASRVRELELEIKALRQENRNLQEANEELQAQLLTHGLEEGRVLLTGTDNSLAAEFEAMGQEDVRKALREQQEVNAQLRSYIEGILLNIVENQPQLLERKQGEN